jgi:hypothetical protein
VLAVAIDIVKIPQRCPRANCLAERFELTAATELTDPILIFGETHTKRYNSSAAPDHPASAPTARGSVTPADAGGLINEYERVAGQRR